MYRKVQIIVQIMCPAIVLIVSIALFFAYFGGLLAFIVIGQWRKDKKADRRE